MQAFVSRIDTSSKLDLYFWITQDEQFAQFKKALAFGIIVDREVDENLRTADEALEATEIPE
jgi:hypothetical protein